MNIIVTRDQMLAAEVSRRLAAEGHPHDAVAVTEVIYRTRTGIAGALRSQIPTLLTCRQHSGCICRIQAVVFEAVADEISEGWA